MWVFISYFLDEVEVYAAINECVEAAKCQPNGLGGSKVGECRF